MRILITLLAVLIMLEQSAFAQTYPSRPIRLIVPFAPGGSADGVARPLAEKLGAILQQPVIVDNRPGGLTVVGADHVAKSPADGYTLFLMPGTHVLTPYLMKKVPYDPIRDFTPVALIGMQGLVLSTNSQQPIRSMAELLTYSKANPGTISLAVSDTVAIVIASMLKPLSGIDFNIVNYKGAGPLSNDLLGNQVTLAITGASITPQVTAGKLRALAVSSPARLPFLPDAPALAEVYPGSNFDIQTWYAIAGPASLRQDVVLRLSDAIAKVLAMPDMKARLLDISVVTPSDAGPEALGKLMTRYKERLGTEVEAAGIKPQ